MEWIINEIYEMISQLYERSYPYMVIKSILGHTLNFQNGHLTFPIAIILSAATMIPFSEFLLEWWYAPAWMIVVLTLIYVMDLYYAILLTGRMNGKAWEFRSDKFAIWVSNWIGALIIVGVLHFLPIAAKSILTSKGLIPENIQTVHNSLMGVAWAGYIGICVSNGFSALSNAVRAGALKKWVKDWVISKLDAYKPSIYDKAVKDELGEE